MIESADELVRLHTSEDPDAYRRAAHEEAPLAVWWAVVGWFPELRAWVAHNKTVPVDVLEVLARDADWEVGWP